MTVKRIPIVFMAGYGQYSPVERSVIAPKSHGSASTKSKPHHSPGRQAVTTWLVGAVGWADSACNIDRKKPKWKRGLTVPFLSFGRAPVSHGFLFSTTGPGLPCENVLVSSTVARHQLLGSKKSE